MIIDLFKYIKQFNDIPVNNFSFKYFIDSVYKFVFVLANTYPEFLSYYYFNLISALPSGDSFLQLKNIILYCAPADVEQLDPFFDDFKVFTQKLTFRLTLFLILERIQLCSSILIVY